MSSFKLRSLIDTPLSVPDGHLCPRVSAPVRGRGSAALRVIGQGAFGGKLEYVGCVGRENGFKGVHTYRDRGAPSMNASCVVCMVLRM